MLWKGETIVTYQNLVDNIVDRVASREEAQEFLELYAAENPAARWNLGYLTGYLDAPTAARVLDWFGVEHPFLSPEDLADPAKALKAGIALGQAAARGQRSKDLDNFENFVRLRHGETASKEEG